MIHRHKGLYISRFFLRTDGRTGPPEVVQEVLVDLENTPTNIFVPTCYCLKLNCLFPPFVCLEFLVKGGAGERSDQAVDDIGCWMAQLPFLCLTPSNWWILGKNLKEGTKPKGTISTTEMFFDGWNSHRFIAAHFKTGVCKERRWNCKTFGGEQSNPDKIWAATWPNLGAEDKVLIWASMEGSLPTRRDTKYRSLDLTARLRKNHIGRGTPTSRLSYRNE